MKRLLLRCHQSPGDVLMLTAAVRDLHAIYPGEYATDVRTSAPELWRHNPYLTPLDEADPSVIPLDMHYPLIHQSNQRPVHFLHGYAEFLARQIERPLTVTAFRGDLHLAAEEQAWPPCEAVRHLPRPYWIVVAGGKFDFTAKWWNPASFQAVVDHFAEKIKFVQCGAAEHWHPPLRGVTQLVGQTTLRQLMRLVHHAEGVLCGVSLPMHLAAAVSTPPSQPRLRACVVVAGGREPAHWEMYPGHQFLSTIGALPCCETGGCWKSRCQTVGDGDLKDTEGRCERPVAVGPELLIPHCLQMIAPQDVIRRIESYYQGGLRSELPQAAR